jgi:hypothetical protein
MQVCGDTLVVVVVVLESNQLNSSSLRRQKKPLKVVLGFSRFLLDFEVLNA